MGNQLPSYIRKFRRLSGLGQGELAVLLGCDVGSKVSRYERQVRIPDLHSALALQIVFDVPVHELFPSILNKVELGVIGRTHQLIARLSDQAAEPLARRKLQFLYEIASRQAGARPS